jgi:hypothetical protein
LASTINASSSSGIVTTADTSAILQLQTAGTTALTVDTSANVGIGTTTPASKLQVLDATAPTLQLSDGSGRNIKLSSGTASTSPSFGSYYASDFLFYTNSTERMRILAGAPILSLSGGSTTATGTGIAFPATQSASSDANTLDDYEEGTWTPAITGITSVAYGQQYGTYIKIGKQVTCFIRLLIASGTGSGTIVTITGLPFTSASLSGTGNGGGAMGYKQLTASAIYPHVADSSTTVEFYLTASSAPTAFTLSGAVSGYHIFYVTYPVA